MTKQELKDKLQGEYWRTMTSGDIPKDSISLEALVDILSDVIGTFEPEVRELKPGVVKTGHMYHLNGKLIKKSEAYV